MLHSIQHINIFTLNHSALHHPHMYSHWLPVMRDTADCDAAPGVTLVTLWHWVWHSLVTGRGRELTRALPVPHWAPHTQWLVTTSLGLRHTLGQPGSCHQEGGGHQPSSWSSQVTTLLTQFWSLEMNVAVIVSRSHYCLPGWCVASPRLWPQLVPARLSQDSGESCESRRSRPGPGQAETEAPAPVTAEGSVSGKRSRGLGPLLHCLSQSVTRHLERGHWHDSVTTVHTCIVYIKQFKLKPPEMQTQNALLINKVKPKLKLHYRGVKIQGPQYPALCMCSRHNL